MTLKQYVIFESLTRACNFGNYPKDLINSTHIPGVAINGFLD